MRNWLTALLYTGLILTANVAAADGIADLRDGDMKKLAVHEAPKAFQDAQFDAADGKISLAEYRGQVVLVNFWAIWCAPCREEMPTLSALQDAYGGEDFAVVTVATGPNATPAIDKFFDDIGVNNLPKYLDKQAALGRGNGVLGLPVSVLLNREGQEVARLTGTADWASDSARAIIEAMINDMES
ncbi:TlpA disulfide reductase family protein [Pseudooceanicola onchidii]|uniref:TlpA disulfide reductase family protein n=1 Tax=Pseudooceanicola onchidii TaxID=2562279 RepID=UPI0010AA20C8|nr:TlpA disulfide reductase family protein [Pseudooceanicola onchidii]